MEVFQYIYPCYCSLFKNAFIIDLSKQYEKDSSIFSSIVDAALLYYVRHSFFASCTCTHKSTVL